MALSYAPFGDDDLEHRVRAHVPLPAYPKGPETTECNYIIMAFIAGFIVMEIIDSLRK